MHQGVQWQLIPTKTPSEVWDKDLTRHALDELIANARSYRSSTSYKELMTFVRRFRFYAPYNAMLVYIQMPGARFVAPAYRWIKDYGRTVKPDARPLVMLQTMGPVMFVFDVSDTEPLSDAKPLPPEVENPFELHGCAVGYELESTIDNAKRDGIRIAFPEEGSQSAGSIGQVNGAPLPPLHVRSGTDKHGNPIFVDVAVKYGLLVNKNLGRAAQYATIVHELAHLYCGHLGTPDKKWKWWPDRTGLSTEVSEFEAESTAHLVCGRLGIDCRADSYLSWYLGKYSEVPPISLECVMKAAGLIEQMGRGRLPLRKD